MDQERINAARRHLDIGAPEFCERAIGLPIAINLGKKVKTAKVLRGTVISAKLHHIEEGCGRNRYNLKAVFEVVVEAGQNKTRHTHLVSTLPQ